MRSTTRAGTLVFIPPGPDDLVYVSAASPPFEPPTGEFAYGPPEDA
jgi:hypothetical protein